MKKGKAGGRKRVSAPEVPDKQGKNREVGYKRPPAQTRWKPGQSGNPAGRPKSLTFSEACRKLLAEIEDETTQETVADALARVAIREARAGSAQHLKEINDRVEGKVTQPIDLGGEVTFRVIYSDEVKGGGKR